MKLWLTEAKCNFTWRPPTPFSSTLVKEFFNITSLETFIIIIFCLIIFGTLNSKTLKTLWPLFMDGVLLPQG